MTHSIKMTPAPLFAFETEQSASAPPAAQPPAQPPEQSAAPAAPGKSGSGGARFHICTICGGTYLFKAVTLCRSLAAVSDDFLLYVCCTDDLAYHTLCRLQLPRCVPVALCALHSEELASLKAARSPSEFCWTLKSFFMLHLLLEHALPAVLYCDSDVFFFDDPRLLFADWGQSSIYLCTQRDLEWVEDKYGKYQAGVIGFKNDACGREALGWWKNRCTEWCSAQPEAWGPARWGDQKYLDELPRLFQSVTASTHPGIDAAPWNTVYKDREIGTRGGRVTIDGGPLIAFHFACLDIFSAQQFDLWHLCKIEIRPAIKNAVYLPYLRALRRSIALVSARIGGDSSPYFSPKSFGCAKTPYIYSERNLALSRWDGAFGFCTISSRTYVAKTLALYGSIKRHLKNFHIWICCMDDLAYRILARFSLENATLLRVSEVETAVIRQTRGGKTLAEYCWTMKPALCSHVFKHYNADRLIYCDSDIYFFSHPRAVHDTWQGYTTLLNRQLGTQRLEEEHGMFQAGMVGFSKAAESLEILKWWRERCTEWCYDDHSDPARWGDQKYLQQIPDKFISIKINDRRGIVAAPWNLVMNPAPGQSVRQAGGDVYIDGEKLVSFHFGSLNILGDDTFDLWKLGPLPFGKDVVHHIYAPYLGYIRTILRAIRANGFDTSRLFADATENHNPFAFGHGQGVYI